MFGEDDRWPLLQRCLTDDSMPLDVRVAGAIMLLLGPPAGRLSNLTADLPAAILADLLGMHVNTAVRWVILARRDWTDYLADRAEEQRTKSKPES